MAAVVQSLLRARPETLGELNKLLKEMLLPSPPFFEQLCVSFLLLARDFLTKAASGERVYFESVEGGEV